MDYQIKIPNGEQAITKLLSDESEIPNGEQVITTILNDETEEIFIVFNDLLKKVKKKLQKCIPIITTDGSIFIGIKISTGIHYRDDKFSLLLKNYFLPRKYGIHYRCGKYYSKFFMYGLYDTIIIYSFMKDPNYKPLKKSGCCLS